MSIVEEHGPVLVYVPTRSILGPGDRVCPELRRTQDGKLALLAYTSLTQLVDGCGGDQPWVRVPIDWFEQIQAECRYDTIALNVALPAECRQRDEGDWPGKPEEWDD